MSNSGRGLSSTGSGLLSSGLGLTLTGSGLSNLGPGLSSTGSGLSNSSPGLTLTGSGLSNLGPGLTDTSHGSRASSLGPDGVTPRSLLPAELPYQRHELRRAAGFNLHPRARPHGPRQALISFGADGDDQLAGPRELLHQRLRNFRSGGGDDD